MAIVPTLNVQSASPAFTPRLLPLPDQANDTQSASTTASDVDEDDAMEDYITDVGVDVDVKADTSLDMDRIHDFGGDGLGVDMRDFTHHDEHEDIKDVAVDAGLATPIMPTQDRLSPQPPTSVSAMGDVPSSVGVEVDVDNMFQTETGLDDDDDDDDDGDLTEGPSSKRSRNANSAGGFTYVDKDGEPSRRKIRIEYIADKSRRHITFSKRKAGIMKKAYELSILTGTQVLLLVVSETGLVYTFTTTKLQPLVQKSEGKNLIQACLNAPDGFGPDGQPLGGPVAPTKSKNGGLAIRPHKLTAAASAAMAASAQAASEEQNQNAAAAAAQTHTQNQTEAAASIGQGTPVAARPKKRMPSGKKRQASNTATQPPPEIEIPPVPSIPEIHRQASPMAAHPSSGGMIDPSLHSPLSAGFHMPPEFQHQHQHHHHQQSHSPNPQHGQLNPNSQQPQQHYGYPTGPDGYPYYAAPPPQQQHHHQQQQQQQHPNAYMTIHHHQQQQAMFQQQQQQQQQRERERMMGMGM